MRRVQGRILFYQAGVLELMLAAVFVLWLQLPAACAGFAHYIKRDSYVPFPCAGRPEVGPYRSLACASLKSETIFEK